MSRDKAGGLVELPECIFVNGLELNETSPVKTLKDASTIRVDPRRSCLKDFAIIWNSNTNGMQLFFQRI